MFFNYKRRPDLPGGPGHSGESGSRGSLDRSPALAGAGRERRASYWLRPLSITEKRSNLVQKPGPANRVPRGAPRFLLRPAGPGRGAAAGCPERAARGVRGSVRFRAARTCRCPASREPGRQTSFHSGAAGRAGSASRRLRGCGPSAGPRLQGHRKPGPSRQGAGARCRQHPPCGRAEAARTPGCRRFTRRNPNASVSLGRGRGRGHGGQDKRILSESPSFLQAAPPVWPRVARKLPLEAVGRKRLPGDA